MTALCQGCVTAEAAGFKSVLIGVRQGFLILKSESGTARFQERKSVW